MLDGPGWTLTSKSDKFLSTYDFSTRFRKTRCSRSAAARLLAKPDSKFGGVQIGINAPYSYHNQFNTGDECLDATVKLNLSAAGVAGPAD